MVTVSDACLTGCYCWNPFNLSAPPNAKRENITDFEAYVIKDRLEIYFD